MAKIKARAELRNRPSASTDVERRPAVPEREARSARQRAAPDRAADALGFDGDDPGAPARARLMTGLQQTVGNGRAGALLAQAVQPGAAAAAGPAGGQPAPAAPPRRDYVFLMGQDRRPGGFYTQAERYYRARVPNATFVRDVRDLDGLLTWVQNNVQDPIGNLYVISHANEDGTLSFGLDAGDQDSHVDVRELREALQPQGGGAGRLPALRNQVDRRTSIHIKGCNLGRTQEIVELIDEAFGGAGTVTAPLHEQDYGFDPVLAQRGRDRFRAEVEQAHPQPPAVDPSLRGRERSAAMRGRRQALRERRAAIARDLRERRQEMDQRAEEAGVYEAFSGPLFQRPGDQLYRREELAPEVDRLYSHLSEMQRARLVGRLIAPDRRSPAVARLQGTLEQRGQRLDRRTVYVQSFVEPRNMAEAVRQFGLSFREQHFRPQTVIPRRNPVDGGFAVTVEVRGTVPQQGEPRRDEVMTFGPGDVVPDNATLIQQGSGHLQNPGRFHLRVEERHSTDGLTTLTVIAERVVSYLHHESLDASRHEHFTRPLDDRNFFTRSTFAPP